MACGWQNLHMFMQLTVLCQSKSNYTLCLFSACSSACSKLTLEYRASSKKGRELSERLNALQEEQKQRAAKRSHHSDQALALSAEVMAMKRKSRMQKVELTSYFTSYACICALCSDVEFQMHEVSVLYETHCYVAFSCMFTV